MPRGSDDEYDDQDLVMSDFSDEEEDDMSEDLLSDDEEQGEEDEVDYTYNELMTAVSKVGTCSFVPHSFLFTILILR